MCNLAHLQVTFAIRFFFFFNGSGSGYLRLDFQNWRIDHFGHDSLPCNHLVILILSHRRTVKMIILQSTLATYRKDL